MVLRRTIPALPALPLRLSPAHYGDAVLMAAFAEGKEEFARAIVESAVSLGWQGRWRGVNRPFACVVQHGHDHADTVTNSAEVWITEEGRLRYHCFRGHQDSDDWSLVHIYTYLQTSDLSVLKTGGLSPGEVRAWTARALTELGFTEDASVRPDHILDPVGESPTVLSVWRGFLLLIATQVLHDIRAIYAAVYSQKFAARWCGIPPATAGRAIHRLIELRFLMPVGKTQSLHAAVAYSVGSAAFVEGPKRIDWWKDMRHGPGHRDISRNK